MRTKSRKQIGMWQAGEDTPLFSGAPQIAKESPFTRDEVGVQPVIPGMEHAYAPAYKRKVQVEPVELLIGVAPDES
jgi:hypothetical protein